MAGKKLSAKLQDWIKARERHRLSHAHVQMARELGMNPRKLGKLETTTRSPGKRRCRSSSSAFTSRTSAGSGPRSSHRSRSGQPYSMQRRRRARKRSSR
jgi:hypothetical protein